MLEIRQMTKRFGGLVAVDDLSFSVAEGQIVGLLGPNGAGKTTVFNMITGFAKPTAGTIGFKDHDITGASPHAVARRGIVRTFQLTSVFSSLTVSENVLAACHISPRISFWQSLARTRGNRRKEAQVRARAEEIMEFVGLQSYTGVTAGSLPHGHKRTLGIAIALAAEPQLLLLDEPLTGMNAGEAEQAVELVDKIRRSGRSILLIEHNMRAAMRLCEHIVVLNFGRKIAEGSPQQIAENEQVIEAYLGVRAHAAQA
jgi:branched-chain amino acid transport system ATP-binding protein